MPYDEAAFRAKIERGAEAARRQMRAKFLQVLKESFERNPQRQYSSEEIDNLAHAAGVDRQVIVDLMEFAAVEGE